MANTEKGSLNGAAFIGIRTLQINETISTLQTVADTYRQPAKIQFTLKGNYRFIDACKTLRDYMDSTKDIWVAASGYEAQVLEYAKISLIKQDEHTAEKIGGEP